MEIHELDLQHIEPKRRKIFEPRTVYDFCKVFSSVTGLPIGKFLKDTKGWPIDWFFSIQSEVKGKPREKQAIYINWFIKKSRPK